MSSSAYSGNPDASPTGLAPAPPPPPPPPPALGQVPTLRINTSDVRSPALRRTPNNIDPYEPPAAIQNAMMTKDKKPFTYTPGMGGKLDLSQIRSPRMARRVAKNANDEGIEGPPKSALESKPLPPSPLAGGHSFAQPQVAVPVFPGSLPSPGQTSMNRTPSAHVTRVPSNVSDGQTVVRNETKAAPATIIPNLPASPQSPTSPPIVTLAKAPTPWLQNKNKPQEELPEWAKRTPGNRGHDDTAGDNGAPPQIYYQQQQQQQQQPPQVFSQPPRQQPIQQVVNNQPRQQDRVIPIRIEDRPSVFAVKNEPGHHQFKQPPSHQQRWGHEQTLQQQYQSQPQYQNQNQQQSSGGGRIIPIMVEDNNGHPQTRTIPIEVQGSRVNVQRGPSGPGVVVIPVNQPAEPGPVQSRAFRVLQKITDTDSDPDIDGNSEQIRKLQLTEDDKLLMNKFKEQVDGDTYLHQEEDPRYRGAAIPSRAFRFLQNMTDSGEIPSTSNAPRHPSAIHKKQNRNSNTFEEAQANLPPSEQQVQEPKKYMGSAIPSRSFRLLQAMTSPEDIAPQENRQQDITSRTENSVQGNQQSGVFFPNCPPTYWSPENGWWGYYPFQYPATSPSQNTTDASSNNIQAYNPYAYCGYGNGNPFAAYYPVYDQNYEQNYHHNNYDRSMSETESASYDYHNYPFYPMDPNNRTEYSSEQVSSPATDCKWETEETKAKNLPREEKKKSNFLTVPKWTNPSRSSSTSSKNSDDTATTNVRGDDSERKDAEKTKIRGQNHTDDDVSSGCTAKSDESDSDSDSDSESSTESSEESTTSEDEEEEEEDTESDSGSEYQAYTTNFDEKREEPRSDCPQSLSATTISEDAYEHSSRLSSDKLSCSDCDSDADDEYQIESLNNDSTLPHQLSVIYEDSEQTETENDSKKLEALVEKGEGETSFNDNDEPPDDGDDATVSVSLPLRFKFSVSENNEDVTTVVVGDSTVKSTRRNASDETNSRTFNEDENNEVRVNIQINTDNETSVDFTLKRHKALEECDFDTEFTLTKEETSVGTRERGTRSVDAEVTLKPGEMDYNANITDPTRFVVDGGEVKSLDCNDNVETEFTIVRRKTDVTKHVWRKDLDLSCGLDDDRDSTNEEVQETSNVTEFSVKNAESGANEVFDADYEVTESKSEVENNVRRDIVERKSLRVKERGSSETEFAVKKIQKIQKKQKQQQQEQEKKKESKMAKDESEKDGEVKNDGLPFEYAVRGDENKRLPSVQNSREETDDEDSGVTSDMSRLISEVDTDSECASTRRGSKYQRTQTHSRLFKLLNDDSILTEDSETESPPPRGGRRDHLSLPLKSSVFNYDENYYSNYSSGITSPDYSPICEQSWRRIHEGSRPFESVENVRGSSATPSNDNCPYLNDSPNFLAALNDKQLTDDEYFQTWKKAASPTSFNYDVVPSIVFKKLQENNNLYETTMPAPLRNKQRVHILCPRIKSSKNVPHVLLSGNPTLKHSPATPTPCCSVTKPPTPIPIQTKITSLKNGHC